MLHSLGGHPLISRFYFSSSFEMPQETLLGSLVDYHSEMEWNAPD